MSVRILQGDVREVLSRLPADAFDCIVTSPPYWGLRDYGVPGQIGLEPTLDGYLDAMVGVCRELRRVLKPTGTFWLNVGDSYAANRSYQVPQSKHQSHHFGTSGAQRVPAGMKPKDLCMVPNRLAIRLQEPWYAGKIANLSDRVWLAAMVDGEGCLFIHRRKAGSDSGARHTRADGTIASYTRQSDTYSPGLEVANTSLAIVERCRAIAGVGSISTQEKDRRQTLYRWTARADECRSVVEEIYPHLVAKQQQARVLLGSMSSGASAAAAHAALIDLHSGKPTDVDFPAPKSLFEPGWFVRSEVIWAKPNPMPESVTDRPTQAHEKVWLLTKSAGYFYDDGAVREAVSANTEWRYPQPDKAARAGVTTNGTGKSTMRAEPADGRRNLRNVWTIATQPFPGAHFATMAPELAERCIKAGCPVGGHVLDPFGGAGTTGLVADRLGRNATLVELNPEYIGIARRRIESDAPLFAEVG